MQFTKLRVLIADDMTSIRGVIKATLKSLGVEEIVEAVDGESAIKNLQGRAFDLVVCDWDMPKASGLQVLQWVRAEEGLKDLPFILLTANAQAGHVKDALLAGVTDYITKPFNPETLHKKMSRIFKA